MSNKIKTSKLCCVKKLANAGSEVRKSQLSKEKIELCEYECKDTMISRVKRHKNKNIELYMSLIIKVFVHEIKLKISLLYY